MPVYFGLDIGGTNLMVADPSGGGKNIHRIRADTSDSLAQDLETIFAPDEIRMGGSIAVGCGSGFIQSAAGAFHSHLLISDMSIGTLCLRKTPPSRNSEALYSNYVARRKSEIERESLIR